MNKITLSILAAGLLASAPVLAQTPGTTQNTGPQGTGNFVAGTAPSPNTGAEGTGNFVAGTAPSPKSGPEGTGNYVNGKPVEKK